MLVCTVFRENCCVNSRPAVKNHRRSRKIGPPNVYSYVGTTLSSLVSLAKESPVRLGTSVRQLSLCSVSRNEPVNWLPPDFVIMFTTPPPKRPQWQSWFPGSHPRCRD